MVEKVHYYVVLFFFFFLLLTFLHRGLEFTAQSLIHSLDNPNEELTVSFTLAYDKTLRPHHSFIVRPLFTVSDTLALKKIVF